VQVYQKEDKNMRI